MRIWYLAFQLYLRLQFSNALFVNTRTFIEGALELYVACRLHRNDCHATILFLHSSHLLLPTYDGTHIYMSILTAMCLAQTFVRGTRAYIMAYKLALMRSKGVRSQQQKQRLLFDKLVFQLKKHTVQVVATSASLRLSHQTRPSKPSSRPFQAPAPAARRNASLTQAMARHSTKAKE